MQDSKDFVDLHDLKSSSPLAVFEGHCRAGKLAYQATPEGRAIFPPRVSAPGSGGPLAWRMSTGLGTVYSTTVVHPHDGTPYNVALIDLDEGFRMMSRVEDLAPEAVSIGLRVKVRMATEEGVSRPVFIPAEAA